MNYRFTGLGARFYPDIRDSEGKSLMATEGTVFAFDATPPSDGLWVPQEDAQPVEGQIQEAPESPPAPVTPPPAPEPPAVDPEPVPVPEPAPVPVTPWSFPGFAPAVQPYAR